MSIGVVLRDSIFSTANANGGSTAPQSKYHTTITQGNTAHETFQFLHPFCRLLVKVTGFLTKQITSHMEPMQSHQMKGKEYAGANASSEPSDTVLFSANAQSAILRPSLEETKWIVQLKNKKKNTNGNG